MDIPVIPPLTLDKFNSIGEIYPIFPDEIDCIGGEEKMTINEYQKECLRTEPDAAKISNTTRLENGLMGLNGEAGEAIDILKKHLFQGHELDCEHLAKELGDVAWYLAISADALGYDLETIFQMNVDKLKARYPDGFDKERSKYRKAGDI